MDGVAEGVAAEVFDLDFVNLAMYDLFSAVTGWVQDMLVALVPIMGPVVGGIILATLGWRLTKRFAK